jgi:hypothetical protein
MKIIKTGLYIALFLVLGSCNGFLDVNTDPTKVSEAEVNVDVLLPSIIDGTSTATYAQGYYSARVTHHLDDIVGGYYEKFTMDGAWSTIYLTNLNNLEVLIEKAAEEGSPHYSGAAKVLKAYNLGLLTDAWEDVPYSEALQGSNNVAPAYDAQQEIYGEIQSLLDEALLDLASEENYRALGADDFIYGGDVDKWIRAAHSLKARYMLHLSNKASINWNNLLAEVDDGLVSNDDDFELNYTTEVANPWYSSTSRKILESIYTLTYGAYFVDNLNGNMWGVEDPRLGALVELEDPEDTEYHGLASYDPDAPTYNVLPTVNTFYMGTTSPVVMMSYAELKFIEAEAAMNAGDTDRAQSAYEAAIHADMSKLGVEESLVDEYLANSSAGNASMQNIMTQKQIALVLNPEAWNDMRRHDFSSDVFKDFIVPEWNGRTEAAQRAEYPSSEASRNKDNYEANLKDFTQKMWKDQN